MFESRFEGPAEPGGENPRAIGAQRDAPPASPRHLGEMHSEVEPAVGLDGRARLRRDLPTAAFEGSAPCWTVPRRDHRLPAPVASGTRTQPSGPSSERARTSTPLERSKSIYHDSYHADEASQT